MTFKLSKTSERARWNAYGGCVISLLMAIPACLYGGVAKAARWEETEFGREPTEDEYSLILPLCLQYLTPGWVAFLGLGAVSAAVMSSTDSSMLSASSMLARNVYKVGFRPQVRSLLFFSKIRAFYKVNKFVAQNTRCKKMKR